MSNKPSPKRRWVLPSVLGLILLLAGIYFTAPWFHGIWFNVFYVNPGFWIYSALAVVITGVVAKLTVREEKDRWGSTELVNWRWTLLTGIVFLLGLISYAIYAPSAATAALAQKTNYEKIDALSATTSARYLPLEVAATCATTRLNDSRVVMGDIDPIDSGGELHWVAPLTPNGILNSWTGNTTGPVVIKPDKVNGCVLERFDAKFTYGEDMLLTDEVWVQLVHRNYWAEIPEIFYQVDTQTKKVFGVAPYMRFELNWPLLYQTPYWGGVFVIHPDGNIEDLTPEQAQNDPRLAGQRLFPEKLAWKIGEARAYKNGVLNAWFTHHDQTQIPDIPGSLNQMPFLLPTETGPVWSFTLEPYGRTFGLYEVMNIDARTGKVSVFRPSDGTNYIGVNWGDDKVVQAFPSNNWVNGEAGTNMVIEPRPVVKGKDLYWQHTVTSRRVSSVASTTLTHAITGQVIVVCGPDELDGFLAGTFPGRGSLCVQQDPGAVQQAPNGQQPQPVPGGPVPGDLTGISDQELIDLGRRVMDEIGRRTLPPQ